MNHMRFLGELFVAFENLLDYLFFTDTTNHLSCPPTRPTHKLNNRWGTMRGINSFLPRPVYVHNYPKI
jgi:hypothetical protein